MVYWGWFRWCQLTRRICGVFIIWLLQVIRLWRLLLGMFVFWVFKLWVWWKFCWHGNWLIKEWYLKKLVWMIRRNLSMWEFEYVLRMICWYDWIQKSSEGSCIWRKRCWTCESKVGNCGRGTGFLNIFLNLVYNCKNYVAWVRNAPESYITSSIMHRLFRN